MRPHHDQRPRTAVLLSLTLLTLGPWSCTRPAPSPRTAAEVSPAPPPPPPPELLAEVSAASQVGTAAPEAEGDQEYQDPLEGLTRPLTEGFALTACEYQDLGDPVERELVGCETAACIDGAGLSICRCLNDEGSWLRVRRGVTTLATIDVTDDMMTLEAFTAALADLDGDGQRELVTGARIAIMCGPGAETWRLTVVDLDSPRAEPLTFTSGDFGPDAFLWSEEEERCALLATAFYYVDFLDYRYVARPVFYDPRGFFTPATSLPVLVTGFDNIQRVAWGDDDHPPDRRAGPRTWLEGSWTEALLVDLPVRGAVQATRQVTLAAAEPNPPGPPTDMDSRPRGGLILHLDASGEEQTRLRFGGGERGGVETLDFIGLLPSGRILPSDYASQGLAAQLLGRRGRLEERATDYDQPVRVLWLEP